MVSSFGFITFQKFKNRKELILKRLFVLKMENLFREKKSDELLGKVFIWITILFVFRILFF